MAPKASSSFTFLPLGAIIQRFEIDGTNIVQNFPTADDYKKYNAPFFGETIGRVANRLDAAKLHNVNGREVYQLAANDGSNALHGGVVGWGKKKWAGPTPVAARAQVPGLDSPLTGAETVRFALTSPDGDEGYPGKVHVTVTYTTGYQKLSLPSGPQEATVLVIEYEAELIEGANETAINMTNHSYFHLSDDPTIAGTSIELATNAYLPVDAGGIPTGGPVASTVVPGAKPFVLGPVEPIVDDCFVVNKNPSTVPIDTRGLPLVRQLAAHHPKSRIHLEVLSTEPAFQFYTGRFVDVPAVSGVPARGSRCAFCLEPSRYVNAANVKDWRNMSVLKKGEKYGARIVYRGWRAAA